MKRLPLWIITDKFPAFYDAESATAIEQTAKVYGAMNTLIDETNKFIESFNGAVERVEKEFEEENNLFKQSINTQIYDFTKVVGLKLTEHEQRVNELITVYKTDIDNNFSAFTNGIDTLITNYKNDMQTQYNAFTANINSIVEQQNTTIAEAKAYMEENIVDTTKSILNEKIEAGELGYEASYDETTEELTFKVVTGEAKVSTWTHIWDGYYETTIPNLTLTAGEKYKITLYCAPEQHYMLEDFEVRVAEGLNYPIAIEMAGYTGIQVGVPSYAYDPPAGMYLNLFMIDGECKASVDFLNETDEGSDPEKLWMENSTLIITKI